MKERKPQGYWNYEACKEESQKYNTKSEFRKGSNGAYDAAYRNGWIKEYDWLEKPRIAQNKKWTKEACAEESRKYQTRGEFCKYSGVAYGAALKNGWLDEFDWLKVVKKPNGFWNYDSCLKEAKKYRTMTEFRKYSSVAYTSARNNGWLAGYDWLEQTRAPRGHWNYDTCKEEARKYMSRTDFCKGSVGAYTAALDNGWIDEYDWFDDIDISFKTQRGHCVYVYVWEPEMVAYVGLTHLKQRRHRDHSSEENSPVFRYSRDNYLQIPEPIYLEEKLAYGEAQEKEAIYIEQYKQLGYEMLNSAAAGSLGGFGKGKWNYDTCREFASNYKTRSEFQKASMAAYNVALRNGWLDEYTWFEQKQKPIGYWTYDTCMEEAKKCRNRSELMKISKGAYDVARKNGWLDEYTWFESAIIWTYESCKEEAKKYKTKRDFQKGCVGAYTAALKHKWLKKYDWFEVLWERKWNYDTCMEESKKYKSKSEFMKGTPGAYNVANKNRWLDKYEWLKHPTPKNTIWNYDSCRTEAKKYKSKSEFMKGSVGAYTAALKKGWIDEYNWFEIKWQKKWNYDTCMEEAKKYKTKSEFQEYGHGAYASARKNGWLNEYDWFEQKQKQTGYWTCEKCLEEAKKYKTKENFRKCCSAAYSAAKKSGWLAGYDWLEVKKGKWNHDTCFMEAKKYKTRKEFCKGSKTAYEWARSNGWIDEYDWFEKIKGIWTYDTCFEEAKKYTSQSDLKKKW